VADVAARAEASDEKPARSARPLFEAALATEFGRAEPATKADRLRRASATPTHHTDPPTPSGHGPFAPEAPDL